MPGWADQAQRVPILAANKSLGRIADRPGGHQCHAVGRRTDDRVGLDVVAARFRDGPNLVDIPGRMDPGKPGSRDRFELDATAFLLQPGFFEPFGDVADSLRPFGMLARLVVQKARLAVEQRHRSDFPEMVSSNIHPQAGLCEDSIYFFFDRIASRNQGAGKFEERVSGEKWEERPENEGRSVATIDVAADSPALGGALHSLTELPDR